MQIDTLQAMETPEGIDIEFQYAGPIARVLAYLMDIMIKSLIIGAVSIPLSLLGAMGIGVISVIYFLVEWFYPVFFEVLRNGQTIGKASLNLQVISDDGTPINWSKSILRNLLRTVDFLPIGYLLGLISMSSSKEFKRLGDHVAGTAVIYLKETNTSQLKAKHPKEHNEVPRALPIPLSLEEQRAILSFSERRDFFSWERQEELASELGILLPENRDPVVSLYEMAATIKGARQ